MTMLGRANATRTRTKLNKRSPYSLPGARKSELFSRPQRLTLAAKLLMAIEIVR